MPPRRRHTWDDTLGTEGRILVRWETERAVVSFAVLLLANVDGIWRTVVLFDCTHGERNDRHRYSFDGVKGAAVIFHYGSPGEAMNDAIRLIRSDHERMIERWRW
jgi:hypothetical protein